MILRLRINENDVRFGSLTDITARLRHPRRRIYAGGSVLVEEGCPRRRGRALPIQGQGLVQIRGTWLRWEFCWLTLRARIAARAGHTKTPKMLIGLEGARAFCVSIFGAVEHLRHCEVRPPAVRQSATEVRRSLPDAGC